MAVMIYSVLDFLHTILKWGKGPDAAHARYLLCSVLAWLLLVLPVTQSQAQPLPGKNVNRQTLIKQIPNVPLSDVGETVLGNDTFHELAGGIEKSNILLQWVAFGMGLILIWVIVSPFYIFKYLLKELKLKPHPTTPDETDSPKADDGLEDILIKEKQITELVLHLAERSDFIKSLKQQLKRLSGKSQIEAEKQIKSLIQSINDFLRSKAHVNGTYDYVDKVNLEFYHKLKLRHPDLTENELRICGLIRLGLNTKEIASSSNVTMKATEMAKYRLKKKFGLGTSTKLSDYIYQIR